MTDVGTGFLQAVSAFCATRLASSASTSWKDAKALVTSLGDGVPDNTKPAWQKLKDDVEAGADLVSDIVKKIEKQTAVIGKMASESVDDAGRSDFTVAMAGRIASRIGTALLAVDEAVLVVATELAKDADGDVDEARRDQLMGIWNPWAQPFKDLGAGVGKMLDSFGDAVLGEARLTKELSERVTYDRERFRLAARIDSTAQKDYGALRLTKGTLEAFLGFARREFVNPSEEQKKELVEKDGKWWRADEAVVGLRIFTTIEPGLQQDPLLKQVMPGSKEPKAVSPTTVTLDSVDGLYLGDGQGSGNEKAVLPVQFNAPGVELRESALGIVRNKAREVTGLEVTSVLALRLGDVVGMQVGGVGATIALDGEPAQAGMFPWDVSPRWPDQIGLRVKTAAVKGGGYLERVTRTYGTGDSKVELVEFGGVIQLEIVKVGVYAIGILSPDPFSLVLVMGVRFPKAIELSFGFTLNAVGGLLAVNRRVDTGALVKAMGDHLLDRMLFPDDPVAEAPKLLGQVAHVFPPHEGGFVVGPIVELGWGSEAKIVEAKLGIVLALPDPKVILLGALRVRAPSKVTPLTDFRCEIYGEITGDRLLIIASLRDSKIAGITVSGDLGLLLQWGGGGDFALSVGGFNPRYESEPAELKELQRLTMDLSPPAVVKVIVKAYFAVTAGAVMAGVRGELKAKVGPAKLEAWVELDMIFFWVPHFHFAVDIGIYADVSVFGHSFAKVSFKGELTGTTPWSLQGTGEIDVWFLPTISLDFGPIRWGDPAPALPAPADPLAQVKQALDEAAAWKAVLPLDGDVLAALGRVDVPGLVAHPLAALEVTQSRVPLETHLERIGSARVVASRVAVQLPRTTAGPVGAVSTVRAPFAPGQFLALEGEALLARSGFEDLPSGCRIGAATTPVSGRPQKKDVRWRTYFRDDDAEHEQAFDPRMFAEALVQHSLVGRRMAERENPYLPRPAVVAPRPGEGVSVLPRGVAQVRQADDGAAVLADLGLLGATEAARIADVVNASGAGHVAAVAVGVR